MILVHSMILVTDTNDEKLKNYVSDLNKDILLGNTIHTKTVTVTELLGDPNFIFSEEIAEKLATANILSRSPVLDARGNQDYISLQGQKSLLWDYSWQDTVDFSAIPTALLAEVSWDLRNHPHLTHVSELNHSQAVDVSTVTTERNFTEIVSNEEFDSLSEKMSAIEEPEVLLPGLDLSSFCYTIPDLDDALDNEEVDEPNNQLTDNKEI